MKTIILLFSSILFTCIANAQGFFFTADDGTHGVELWHSDGNEKGTKMVLDINKTAGRGSNPSQLTLVGKTLFFTADNGVNGVELWRSDGTDNGTKMVIDINTKGYHANSNPSQLKAVGNSLFFIASDGANRVALWKSDETGNGAKIVRYIK